VTPEHVILLGISQGGAIGSSFHSLLYLSPSPHRPIQLPTPTHPSPPQTKNNANTTPPLALLTLLTTPFPLGATIALNTWLPLASHLSASNSTQHLSTTLSLPTTHSYTPTNSPLATTDDSLPTTHSHSHFHPPTPNPLTTPLFLAHTTDDEIIDIKLGQQTQTILSGFGIEVTWVERVKGGHLGFLEREGGVDDIVAFLKVRG